MKIKIKNLLILLSLVPFVLFTFAVILAYRLVKLPFVTLYDTIAAYVDSVYDHVVCKRGHCERAKRGAEPCAGCEYADKEGNL